MALAAASLAILSLLLLAAELGVRRFGSRGPDAAVDLARLHRFSATLGWEPRPGARYCEAGHCASVNGEGYRGEAVAAAPGVLMLGDSITFGLDVDDEQTFSALMAKALPAPVVNFAVQGYGPDQSLIRLQQQGLAHRPRVVV